jgi:phospholipid transport system substrate-binding protein
MKGSGMKCLRYAVLSLLFFSQAVTAYEKIAPEEFLKNKLDAVTKVLQNKDLEQQIKNEEILAIMTPIFDFSLMAKLTLGRKYWPGLNEKNKKKFTELFIKRLKASYLTKLGLYSDEKIIYEPANRIENKFRIPTYLISKDQKTSMVYKLYELNNTWKIYDIEVEGVSIIRSYRAQFDEFLQSGTIEDLILKLEK